MKITFTITVDIDDQEITVASQGEAAVPSADCVSPERGSDGANAGGSHEVSADPDDAAKKLPGGTHAAPSSPAESETGKISVSNSPVTATRRVDGFGSVQDALKMSTNGPNASAAEQQNSTGKAVDTSLTVVGTESGTVVDLKPVVLRPHCLNPDACGGYSDKHCHACTRSLESAEETRQHIRAAFKGAVG